MACSRQQDCMISSTPNQYFTQLYTATVCKYRNACTQSDHVTCCMPAWGCQEQLLLCHPGVALQLMRSTSASSLSQHPSQKKCYLAMQVLCSGHQPHLSSLWQIHCLPEGPLQWCPTSPGHPPCLQALMPFWTVVLHCLATSHCAAIVA